MDRSETHIIRATLRSECREVKSILKRVGFTQNSISIQKDEEDILSCKLLAGQDGIALSPDFWLTHDGLRYNQTERFGLVKHVSVSKALLRGIAESKLRMPTEAQIEAPTHFNQIAVT